MDDLISREAAIDAVGYYSLHSGDKLLFADKPLKELPAAQPQRMRGRWIRHKDWVSEGYCEYTCSECDMGVDAMYNYCPRCGAYMREGEQDE